MADSSMPSGLLVGGADQGIITMYDAAKLVKGEDNALVFTKDKHTGPVDALDFNPFQSNLLASGGGTADRCIKFWNTHTGAHLSSNTRTHTELPRARTRPPTASSVHYIPTIERRHPTQHV